MQSSPAPSDGLNGASSPYLNITVGSRSVPKRSYPVDQSLHIYSDVIRARHTEARKLILWIDARDKWYAEREAQQAEAE